MFLNRTDRNQNVAWLSSMCYVVICAIVKNSHRRKTSSFVLKTLYIQDRLRSFNVTSVSQSNANRSFSLNTATWGAMYNFSQKHSSYCLEFVELFFMRNVERAVSWTDSSSFSVTSVCCFHTGLGICNKKGMTKEMEHFLCPLSWRHGVWHISLKDNTEWEKKVSLQNK